MLVTLLIIYAVGFPIHLVLLHLFAKKLGWDHYDPPHVEYYDDYDNNAQAYVAFSLGWPLFVIGNLVYGGGILLVRLSKYIERQLGTTEK